MIIKKSQDSKNGQNGTLVKIATVIKLENFSVIATMSERRKMVTKVIIVTNDRNFRNCTNGQKWRVRFMHGVLFTHSALLAHQETYLNCQMQV